MKYAAKPQKLNPNKPPSAGDWDVWEKIEFDGIATASMQSEGWSVSDTDNIDEWFQMKKLVPKSITPRQARHALIRTGISLEMIETAFNSLPSPIKELAKVEWDYSLAIERERQLTKSVASLLGWTEYQLDQLFIYAGSL